MSRVADHCSDHGLALQEEYPAHAGFVARVRDASGRIAVLKSAVERSHDSVDEAEALRLWAGRSVVPGLIQSFADGCHLRQFIHGAPLSEAPGQGSAHARQVGALLAALHAPVTASLIQIPDRWFVVEAAILATSTTLSDTDRARAARLATVISATTERVMVHGDCYPRNIVETAAGLTLIDPLARRDLAAADVASFVLTSPGDWRLTLDEVTIGYDAALLMRHEYIEWWALRNSHYRSAYERAHADDPTLRWQPCYVASGNDFHWVD